MRIIIDIDGVRTREPPRRKTVRCRTRYYASSKDEMRVHNCGVEIYKAMCEIFDKAFEGGVIRHEGEQK